MCDEEGESVLCDNCGAEIFMVEGWDTDLGYLCSNCYLDAVADGKIDDAGNELPSVPPALIEQQRRKNFVLDRLWELRELSRQIYGKGLDNASAVSDAALERAKIALDELAAEVWIEPSKGE